MYLRRSELLIGRTSGVERQLTAHAFAMYVVRQFEATRSRDMDLTWSFLAHIPHLEPEWGRPPFA